MSYFKISLKFLLCVTFGVAINLKDPIIKPIETDCTGYVNMSEIEFFLFDNLEF